MMTNKIKLTKKEEIIFHQFLQIENYSAYPARIEKDLGKEYEYCNVIFINDRGEEEVRNEKRIKGNRISRATVSKICQKFEKMGILKHSMDKAPRQRFKTEYYYLDQSGEGFLKIVNVLLNSNRYLHHNLFCPILSGRINERLVIDVLRKKEVCLNRMFALDEFENREYDGKIIYLPKHTHLRFPVMAPDELDSDGLEIIKNDYYNRDTEFNDEIIAAIKEHYSKFQREKLILPILSLILSSYEALNEFLFGDWKPSRSEDYISFNFDGTREIKHVIYRLIIRAINEIAQTRQVADERSIRLAKFGIDSWRIKEKPSIFNIVWGDGTEVHFNVGFDTEVINIGDEEGNFVEINRNPDVCQVETWILQPRPIPILIDDLEDKFGD